MANFIAAFRTAWFFVTKAPIRAPHMLYRFDTLSTNTTCLRDRGAP